MYLLWHPIPNTQPQVSVGGERVSEFELKQMELNVETLGIPEAAYDATVTMPAADFQRICKDLTSFGETIAVSVVKDAIKFHVTGDVGDASVTVRQVIDGNKVRQHWLHTSPAHHNVLLVLDGFLAHYHSCIVSAAH